MKNQRELRKQWIKRKKLEKKFRIQKKLLKKRFDLRKKLEPEAKVIKKQKDVEALNLSVCLDETIKEEKVNKAIYCKDKIDEGRACHKKLNISQINLAKNFVEGEDVGGFSVKWQEYFFANENKSTVEKINNMVKGNNQ